MKNDQGSVWILVIVIVILVAAVFYLLGSRESQGLVTGNVVQEPSYGVEPEIEETEFEELGNEVSDDGEEIDELWEAEEVEKESEVEEEVDEKRSYEKYDTFIVFDEHKIWKSREAIIVNRVDTYFITEDLAIIKYTDRYGDYAELKSYLDLHDIAALVGYGGEDMDFLTDLRRATGISIIVKFAKGARAPTGEIAAVEPLY